MKIIGAGMAGLLAANMLHRLQPTVLERQPALPNNHSAVLRFGSEKVSDALGIPFKKVKLIKTYLPWRNKVADCLMYSTKCSGIARSDRSIISEAFAADRWIAPTDLIQRMAANVDVRYQVDFDPRMAEPGEPIISTIPMPALMKLLDYAAPKFEYVSGFNLRATINNCDAYISVYVPDPKFKFNRISITGNELIVEYARCSRADIVESDFFEILDLLGISSWATSNVMITEQQYAKIQPIDDDVRKEFQHWATDRFNIFSLGRFATWRPGLQLCDLVQDIRKIESWTNKGKYEVRRAR